MDLFARVSAVKALFHIPNGLRTCKTADNVREWALCTNDTMMGRISIDEDPYSEEDEEQARVQNLMSSFMARREDCAR